jgi:hypothetical protein
MGHRFHYFDIRTLPRLHTIVWCRLPEGDNLKPGTKVRPALVRGSKHDPITGRGALLVSYGTTKLNSNKRGSIDLIIMNYERLSQLNLPHAVRFDLDFANWLPWASECFAPPEHDIHIIAGPLTETEKKRLRLRLQRRGIIQAL